MLCLEFRILKSVGADLPEASTHNNSLHLQLRLTQICNIWRPVMGTKKANLSILTRSVTNSVIIWYFSSFNSKSSYRTRQFIFFFKLKWTCMTSLKILMESETMKLFQAYQKYLMMTDKYPEKVLEHSLVAQTYKEIKSLWIRVQI